MACQTESSTAEPAAQQSPTKDASRQWNISTAEPHEATRLAHLQFSAFKSNELFRVQFPTPEAINGFQHFLTERIKRQIEGDAETVLVIRRQGGHRDVDSDVVAFAIWRPPHDEEEAVLARPQALTAYPPGTNIDVLRAWAEKVSAAYESVMGGKQCFRLEWLVTDKAYEKQGLGSILLLWGLPKAKAANLPVYLESTMESRQFYLKRGFEEVARMKINLHEADGEKEPKMYYEVGLLFRSK